MKNFVIAIDKNCISERADYYFARICGFDEFLPQNEQLVRDAFAVKHEMFRHLCVKCVFSHWDGRALCGSELILSADARIFCNAFARIEPNHVVGIYVFALSVGECFTNDSSASALYYADCWGTAFIDAARDYFVSYILEDTRAKSGSPNTHAFVCSDCFGPGFYGMDLAEIFEMRKVIDFRLAGISQNDSGLMSPAKSCAGVYMVVSDNETLPAVSCADCIGNRGGCAFCGKRL